MTLTRKRYLKLAVPFILSTVTQPLLGAVDTSVVGHLQDDVYLGGVAIGTVIFNTMYWLFGFLRISTSAHSAQASGSGDRDQRSQSLIHPAIIALVTGCLFILCRHWIFELSMRIMNVSAPVAQQASIYYETLIWTAPLVLLNYVLLGWLMGQQDARSTMLLQIGANVLNIVLSIYCVIHLQLNVFGVAIATVVAHVLSFVVGCLLVFRHLPVRELLASSWNIQKDALKDYLTANMDLVIRTVCLLTMTNLFMRFSSNSGSEYLAANSVLWQLQYVLVYFFDGLGNAASVFSGKALGQHSDSFLKTTIRLTNEFALVLIVLQTIILVIFFPKILSLFTSIDHVYQLCMIYKYWLFLYPWVIAFSSAYYGVFTGLMKTRVIRNSMIQSTFVFALCLWIFIPHLGNHGLWLSFIIYSLSRSFLLAKETSLMTVKG